MYEIYNIYTGVVILSGVTFKQAFNWRMMQPDLDRLKIRPVKTA